MIKLIIATIEEVLLCARHIAEHFIYVISDLPKNPSYKLYLVRNLPNDVWLCRISCAESTLDTELALIPCSFQYAISP